MQHVCDEIFLHSMILMRSEIKAAIILKIRRNSLSRRLSHFAIRVVAESGLLYTLASIASFFTSLLDIYFLAFTVTNAIVCYYYQCFWIHI